MSARKWGTSGRVTLDPWTGRRGITDAADVLIDGNRVGHAGKDESGWYGAPSTGSTGANSGDLGSFDAGVMHVLRRVDPALWREERGEVVAVRRAGAFSATPWAWAIVHGEHGPVAFRSTWGEAMSRATEAASA